MDKISIIIPCYNREEFLDKCLESVYNQTYSDWECIIVDDGSDDKSREIANKWCKLDSRFQYFYKENGGVSSARNEGLNKITGDYILFLDSDDILYKTKLEDSMRVFSVENVDMVISDFRILVDDKINPAFCNISDFKLEYKTFLLNWDVDFNLPIHTCIFSKKILGSFQFKENFKAKEDWLMWLDIFRSFPKVKYLNKPLVLYRMHKNNMTKCSEHMTKYTEKVYQYILNNIEKEFYEAFLIKIRFDKLVKKQQNTIYYLENRILKITQRPWYKKIFYAVIGKK